MVPNVTLKIIQLLQLNKLRLNPQSQQLSKKKPILERMTKLLELLTSASMMESTVKSTHLKSVHLLLGIKMKKAESGSKPSSSTHLPKDQER